MKTTLENLVQKATLENLVQRATLENFIQIQVSANPASGYAIHFVRLWCCRRRKLNGAPSVALDLGVDRTAGRSNWCSAEPPRPTVRARVYLLRLQAGFEVCGRLRIFVGDRVELETLVSVNLYSDRTASLKRRQVRSCVG